MAREICSPILRARHSARTRTELGVTFAYFNMEDPRRGRLHPGKDRAAPGDLRAYNGPDDIRVIRNGQELAARSRFRPMSMGTCRDTRDCRRTIPRRPERYSIGSAIATGTATGTVSCPTAGPDHSSAIPVGAAYRQFDDLWQKSMRESASGWTSRCRASLRPSRPRMRASCSSRALAGAETRR